MKNYSKETVTQLLIMSGAYTVVILAVMYSEAVKIEYILIGSVVSALYWLFRYFTLKKKQEDK